MARRPKGKRRGGTKLKPQSIDFMFLILALSLLAFGLIMVLSAGSTSNTASNPFDYAVKQIKWAALGLAAGGVAMVIPYTFWRRFAGFALLVSIFLLIAVHFSDAAVDAGGSSRWLDLGIVNIQPSELTKLTLVLFFAHILDRYPVRTGKDLLLPIAVLIPIFVLVYKQPDLGTAVVLMAACVSMLLLTELPSRFFFLSAPVVGLLGFFLVRREEYQWNRIVAWLDPWAHLQDGGWQMTNAEIAFGSGGLFGIGLGQSLQKRGILPENHTDYIFAIVGEELGLIGATLLIVLFVLLFRQGYRIARNCPDRFGRLLAYGLTSALAIQAAINLAVVTGVFPVTGITLPLISYGGNSLLISMVEIGILLNISRYHEVVTVQPTIESSIHSTSV